MNLFPLMSWDLIADAQADALLTSWEHFLGPCGRPFGRHSWGLTLEGELVAVAVSASTASDTCWKLRRNEVVELARLCTHPEHRDLTRVALRLWRKTALQAWGREYWPVRACVSYADKTRHQGDIYRFDGWRKVREDNFSPRIVVNHGRSVELRPKSLWVWEVPTPAEPVVPAEPHLVWPRFFELDARRKQWTPAEEQEYRELCPVVDALRARTGSR